MNSQDQSKDDTNTTTMGNKPSILYPATLIYAVMAAIGALLSHYQIGNLPALLSFSNDISDLSTTGAAILLSTGVLLISNYLFSSWFESFRALKQSLMPILGPSPLWASLYLAAISSLGEELFFRAALLPYTGLFLSSLLFGLLHLGPDGRLGAWSIWAFLAGLLLGWMVEATTSLLPALGTHFLINFIGILNIQLTYRKKHRTEKEAAPSSQDL